MYALKLQTYHRMLEGGTLPSASLSIMSDPKGFTKAKLFDLNGKWVAVRLPCLDLAVRYSGWRDGLKLSTYSVEQAVDAFFWYNVDPELNPDYRKFFWALLLAGELEKKKDARDIAYSDTRNLKAKSFQPISSGKHQVTLGRTDGRPDYSFQVSTDSMVKEIVAAISEAGKSRCKV